MKPDRGAVSPYLRSAVVVLVDEDRRDRQRGVDERDLDAAIPLGGPPDERQGGQDPFGVCEVLARPALGGWLFMGRAPSRSTPRLGAQNTGRGANPGPVRSMIFHPTAHRPERRNPRNIWGSLQR